MTDTMTGAATDTATGATAGATPGAADGAATHLLSVADLGAEGIEELLDVSDSFVEVSERAIPKVPALRGKTVVSLFYEDSTRTRLSFETAARRLSADVMNFSVGSSSVAKGESLRDTVQTIDAMGVDALVVRHKSAGVPWQDVGAVGHACPLQAHAVINELLGLANLEEETHP